MNRFVVTLNFVAHKCLTISPQPDERDTPTTIGHFLNGSDSLRELNTPLFEIKQIPG